MNTFPTEEALSKQAKARQIWYFIERTECVLCGRSTEYRERRIGNRPEKYEDRHHFRQDACSQHFM